MESLSTGSEALLWLVALAAERRYSLGLLGFGSHYSSIGSVCWTSPSTTLVEFSAAGAALYLAWALVCSSLAGANIDDGTSPFDLGSGSSLCGCCSSSLLNHRDRTSSSRDSFMMPIDWGLFLPSDPFSKTMLVSIYASMLVSSLASIWNSYLSSTSVQMEWHSFRHRLASGSYGSSWAFHETRWAAC